MVAGMAEAGQSYDEPLHREEEGRPHQDALAEIDLWGISPCRWYDGFDGQDATRADGRFLEDVAACLDLVAHVAACRRPRGANVLLLGC
jgi:hypothetical protein